MKKDGETVGIKDIDEDIADELIAMSEDVPGDSSTDVSMEKVKSFSLDGSSSIPSCDVSLETVILTSSEDESSLRWGPRTDLRATKPFEPFKIQFSPFHYPQPVNLVVPESSDKGATNETNDIKYYVGVANRTVAADGDSEQLVAKE